MEETSARNATNMRNKPCIKSSANKIHGWLTCTVVMPSFFNLQSYHENIFLEISTLKRQGFCNKIKPVEFKNASSMTLPSTTLLGKINEFSSKATNQVHKIPFYL